MEWPERVKATERLHKQSLRNNHKHTIRDTAKILRRSVGSITEDLMIASWAVTYPQIEKMETMMEALSFIREKKLEIKMR